MIELLDIDRGRNSNSTDMKCANVLDLKVNAFCWTRQKRTNGDKKGKKCFVNTKPGEMR